MGVQSLGQGGPLEEGLATHSRILAWRISWTEEPGRLQSGEELDTNEATQHKQTVNYHILDDLETTEIYVPQFWRLEVQDHSTDRLGVW